jgi:recombination protein RecR
MSSLPEPILNLVEAFKKFPGIGRKTAQRMSFFVLKIPREEAINIARAIVNAKDKIIDCTVCNNISETDPCHICKDEKRDSSVIAIVEDAMDVLALEKTGEYHGKYHVLGGLLSPLDGIGPEDLSIDSLLNRIESAGEVKEAILAINPSTEGEFTINYLTKLLKGKNLRVSRLARGIPVGGDVEYADEATLSKALEGRVDL